MARILRMPVEEVDETVSRPSVTRPSLVLQVRVFPNPITMQEPQGVPFTRKTSRKRALRYRGKER